MVPPALHIRRAHPDDAVAIARMYVEPEVQADLLKLPCPSLEGRGHALRNGIYADTRAMERPHPRPPVLGWVDPGEGV